MDLVNGSLEACSVDIGSCSKLSEVELQRACAPLYPAIAVDALANIVLFIFFAHVALLTHVRGKLRSPLRALSRLIGMFVKDYCRELWETCKTVPWMHQQRLAARLRCCANIDKAISVISMCMPLIAITRILNIGNVNGARWIGYTLTCKFMQLELIILIAPIVPCFHLNSLSTFCLTFFCLGKAWIASTIPGELYRGSFSDFASSLDFQDLDITSKGYVILPAMIGMFCIGFMQVPSLWMLYTCRGLGGRRDDMPVGYRTLLVTVVFTWALFPLWWLCSWEGNSLFKDAKFNELGFMSLNMLAKGTFIYQSSRMTHQYEDQYPDEFHDTEREVPDVLSKEHSVHRCRNSAIIATLERFASDGHEIAGGESRSVKNIASIADVISEIASEVKCSQSQCTRSHVSSNACLSTDIKEPAENWTLLRALLDKIDVCQEQLDEAKKVTLLGGVSATEGIELDIDEAQRGQGVSVGTTAPHQEADHSKM
mmetsp:Transcript_15574/g.35727  ORF Transcript_15574/g.35727 Transcript_15574/m.35727 type:complete len:484 (-) Transcript_15574:134-1585(-)